MSRVRECFPTGVPQASLRTYTTINAGGPAEILVIAKSRSSFEAASVTCHQEGVPATILGWGSNVLPSDQGVPGVVLVNQSNEVEFLGGGLVRASTGVSFQELFLQCAQRSLSGLEFAVGIPGTLGGALVSNAGAYRSGISGLIRSLTVVRDGELLELGPECMEFGYRDSVLRRSNPPRMVVTSALLELTAAPAKAIYDLARENQRQRISKQPPPASAGSFFKNVVSMELAREIEGLTDGMRANGVIPAGFLIEKVGLKGHPHKGAQLHPKHANFMTNIGGATATAIRELANIAIGRVNDRFGVVLEEEVLYIGDWSGWGLPAR